MFVDKIYLYDDHFTIYLNNSKKGTNTSKKEVELAEQYFFEPSSESTSGCVPTQTLEISTVSRVLFFLFLIACYKKYCPDITPKQYFF
ncbi:MAG: hypothetical protein PUG78_05710 [Eubacteriales bacterium]|nr:hypothetical protein [Eubacteriales bacterium]